MKKIVFVVLIEEIHDTEMYNHYLHQVVKIIQAHRGEYIARSDKIVPFTGPTPERAIVIAFDSIEDAKGCFFSEEYKKIKHFRENSTRSRAFFIEHD